MENDKSPTDLQGLIDRLRLAMKEKSAEDVPQLAALVEEYGRICEQVNARLRECGEHIERGQYANAVALSEREPNVLSMAVILEMPERETLAAVAGYAGTRAPMLLSRELVGLLQEAHEKMAKSATNLTRLHELTLLRAPLPTRLAVMRQLRLENPNHPFLDSDIRHFEKTWFTRALSFVAPYAKAGRVDVVSEIIEDIEQSGYLETPTPVLIASLKNQLAKAQAVQLPGLAEEIRRQFSEPSLSEMQPLIERWYEMVADSDSAEAEKLGVAPAIAWYEQSLIEAANAEATERARQEFEQLLLSPRLDCVFVEASFAALEAMGGVDDDLKRRYHARLAQVDRKKKRRFALMIGASLLPVAFVTWGAIRIWRPVDTAKQIQAVLAEVESLAARGDFGAVMNAIDRQSPAVVADAAVVAARKKAADQLSKPPIAASSVETRAAEETAPFQAALLAIEQAPDNADIEALTATARRLATTEPARGRVDKAVKQWQQRRQTHIAQQSQLAGQAADVARNAERVRDAARRGHPLPGVDVASLREQIASLRGSSKLLGEADTYLKGAEQHLAAADQWQQVTNCLTQLDGLLNGTACDHTTLERIAHCLSDEVAPKCPDEKIAAQTRLAVTSLSGWKDALHVQELLSAGQSVPAKTLAKWKNEPPAFPLSSASVNAQLLHQRDPTYAGGVSAELKVYLTGSEINDLWVMRRQGQTMRYYVNKPPALENGDGAKTVFVLLDFAGKTAPIEFKGAVRTNRAPQSVFAERFASLWEEPNASADGQWQKLLARHFDALLDSDDDDALRDMEPLVKLHLVERILNLASATSMGYRDTLGHLPDFKLSDFLNRAKRLTGRAAVQQGAWLDPAKLSDERKAAEDLLKQAPRLTELAPDAAQYDKHWHDEIKRRFLVLGWLKRDSEGNAVLSRFASKQPPAASRLYVLVDGKWVEIGKTTASQDQLNSEAETYIGWPVFAARPAAKRSVNRSVAMWLVRIGSKVTGPYSLDQLRTLRQRKQFSPVHQVSSTGGDRWESAAQLIEMIDGQQNWTPPQNARTTADGNSSQAPPAAARPQWYYVDGDEHQIGPVPEDSLRNLFQVRSLPPRTMVCREGDTAWQEARKRPEFVGVLPAPSKAWIYATSGVAVAAAAGGIAFLLMRSPGHSNDPGPGTENSSKPDGKAEEKRPEEAFTPEEKQERIVTQAMRCIARITTRHGNASGFLVSPTILVTNRHVVEDEISEKIEVFFSTAPQGERGPYHVTSLYDHEDLDLAFLAINTNLPYLEFAPEPAFHPGRPVIVIGSPGSDATDTTSDGRGVVVNAVNIGTMSAEVSRNGKPFYHFDITVNHGNSGGPAINSKGELVGVVDIGEDPGKRLNYFIPSYEVKASVERLKRFSEKEIAANAGKHQAKVLFVTIDDVSSTRVAVVDKIREEVAAGARRDGLKEILQKVRNSLDTKDTIIISRFLPHMSSIAADPNIAAPIRENLKGFADNFLELRKLERAYLDGGELPSLQWNTASLNYHMHREALIAPLGKSIDEQLNESKK